MKLFMILFLVFVNAENIYANVSFKTEVTISNYEEKKKRRKMCFSTDEWSKTYTEKSELQLSGKNASNNQVWNKHNRNYLNRKINWDSTETEDSFALNFYSGSSQISGRHDFDKRKCSRKYWRGSTSTTSNTVYSTAVFPVPKNVWIVKISSKYKDSNDNAEINLSNLGYVEETDQNSKKKKKLDKIRFESFKVNDTTRYYLVNPSVDSNINNIYLEFQKKTQDNDAIDFQYKFDIEFLARDYCLSETASLNYQTLLDEDTFQTTNAINTLACMLTPKYVKHITSNMLFVDIKIFFEKLSSFIVNAAKKNASSNELQVINGLVNKIKFYYSFEIIKDLTSQIYYKDNNGLNGLMLLDKLKQRSLLYLSSLTSKLYDYVQNIEFKEKGYNIALSQQDISIMKIFIERLIPSEIEFLKYEYNALPRMQLLSNVYYSSLESAIDKLGTTTDVLVKSSNAFTVGKRIATHEQLSLLKSNLKVLLEDLASYNAAWLHFNEGIFSPSDEAKEIVNDQRKFISEIDALYQINVRGLYHNLESYFTKHFENPEFKRITVNGKTYMTVEEFMNDFQFIRDVKNED